MTTDYRALKKAGFIRQRQEGFFSLRLRVAGGDLSSARLAAIAAAAEKYGAGRAHLTSRQGVEIPFVKLEAAEAISRELASHGLFGGGCGAGPRGVTACQGLEVCRSACIETRTLAGALAGRYAGRELPHKFKIGATGCPNDCLKVEANDLGVKGALRPLRRAGCSLCGACARACPAGALTQAAGGRLGLNRRRCRLCGRCLRACPAEAFRGEPLYLLYFGGTFGSRLAPGRLFPGRIKTTETLFKAADAAMDFFAARGRPGERFRAAIERAGWPVFEAAIRLALAPPA